MNSYPVEGKVHDIGDNRGVCLPVSGLLHQVGDLFELYDDARSYKP
jgi:hypothetical protein